MTKKEAYEILGLPPGTGIAEIKKRYRQLITQAHPDIHAVSGADHTHHAQEINIAYSILKKRKPDQRTECPHNPNRRDPKGKKNAPWNAPVNECAYMEREVLHYAEDCDGSVLGSFCIARGKYLWITEEDFPLFLLSVYQCSKQLLDEIDDRFPGKRPSPVRQAIQAELTYLLAQQFTDGPALLKELAEELPTDKDGGRIFHIPSTLEPFHSKEALSPGEALYPSRIARHKLYLKNQSGQELGYLSFPDDRLYYAAVPLFEQRHARVKIQAQKSASNDRKLHLWIKLPDAAATAMPENLNLQIKQLLDKYKLS